MTTPSTVAPSSSPVKPATTPPSGVPLMGLAEAAKACGISVSTLRRKRHDLEAHGAAQTASGWHIPVTALIALGLMERVTAPPSHETPSGTSTGEVDTLRSQLAAAEQRAAVAEQRAAVAEAVASERERMIQTQAMALRMLEASKTPATPAPTPPVEPAESPVPAPSPEDSKHAPKRAWWRFR